MSDYGKPATKTERTASEVRRVRAGTADSIVTWFDPRNPEHLKAWVYIQRYGKWPAALWDETLWRLHFPNHWQTRLQRKLAETWIDHVLMQGNAE